MSFEPKELSTIEYIVYTGGEGGHYKLSYLVDMEGVETVAEFLPTTKAQLMNFPLVEPNQLVHVKSELGRDCEPNYYVTVELFDPQAKGWRKSCPIYSAVENGQSEIFCRMIQESLHQGLDGWTEFEQKTILKYLEDIGVAVYYEVNQK